VQIPDLPCHLTTGKSTLLLPAGTETLSLRNPGEKGGGGCDHVSVIHKIVANVF